MNRQISSGRLQTDLLVNPGDSAGETELAWNPLYMSAFFQSPVWQKQREASKKQELKHVFVCFSSLHDNVV